jgi:hypothetical protein
MKPKRELTEEEFRQSNNAAIQFYLDESRERMVMASRNSQKQKEKNSKKQPQHQR